MYVTHNREKINIQVQQKSKNEQEYFKKGAKKSVPYQLRKTIKIRKINRSLPTN